MRFLAWCIQWSVGLAVFLLVMAGTGYYVYAFALEGGRHVSVPNIMDMPVTEAAFLLTERGLDLGRQAQAPHPTTPKYYVIGQRPAAGRIAREGRRVNVIVSMGQDYLRAPDLSGKPLEEARREITSARFRVGSLARIPADQPRDTVIGQDPPVGGELADQGEIHLLVSAGSGGPNALMPDLRGLSVSEIAGLFENLDVALVANKVEIPDAAQDVVLAQHPAPDTLIYQGQVVTYDYQPSKVVEAPTMRYEGKVLHQMFYDWFGRNVHVDVVDRKGERQTIWTKAPAFDDAAQQTYVSGRSISVPITYITEATVEVYVDGQLEAAYRLQGGNPPVRSD